MNFNLFADAFYWFLLQPIVVTFIVGTLSSLAILVSLLLVVKKWGEYN